MKKLVLLALVACSSGPASSTDSGSDAGTNLGEAAVEDASAESAMDASPQPPDRSQCAADPDKVGRTKRTLQGAPAYYVYVPATYDPMTPSALIEVLHGAGDVANNYLTLWEQVADQRNAIVLTPEATEPLGNGFTWSTANEKYILAELEEVARCYSVDPKRRILHGFSAGGIIAYWMGLKNAPTYSGISIFASALDSALQFAPNLLPAPWLIPVSHTHGMSDMNFPIAAALAGKSKLEAANHKFHWHPVSGGHTSPATLMNALQTFDDLAASRAP